MPCLSKHAHEFRVSGKLSMRRAHGIRGVIHILRLCYLNANSRSRNDAGRHVFMFRHYKRSEGFPKVFSISQSTRSSDGII